MPDSRFLMHVGHSIKLLLLRTFVSHTLYAAIRLSASSGWAVYGALMAWCCGIGISLHALVPQQW